MRLGLHEVTVSAKTPRSRMIAAAHWSTRVNVSLTVMPRRIRSGRKPVGLGEANPDAADGRESTKPRSATCISVSRQPSLLSASPSCKGAVYGRSLRFVSAATSLDAPNVKVDPRTGLGGVELWAPVTHVDHKGVQMTYLKASEQAALR